MLKHALNKMTEFDLTDSELQDLEEWGESMDFDCLDIIEELQTEPQAKRQKICNEPGLDLQGQGISFDLFSRVYNFLSSRSPV